MALSPPLRSIPTDLRAHSMQAREVVLTDTVTFRVWEAMSQPRPNQWARVWPSSLALGRWFLAQPVGSLPASARELGCGVGLVGLTLAHLGLTVDCTDREPLALAFAARNAAENSLDSMTVSLLDWSAPVGLPTPLLVASDVLYEDATPERLFELLQGASLLEDEGRLVVSGPARRPEIAGRLVERLVDVGYTHVAVRVEVEWDGREESIDVHALQKPGVANTGKR